LIRFAFLWRWCDGLSAHVADFLTANGIGIIPKFILEGLFYDTFR